MDTALIVALVGVGGALLGSAISIVGNCILEVIKSKKEKKNYISKALFEKQFLIYQEFSDKFTKVIECCNNVYSTLEYTFKNPQYTNGNDAFFEECNAFSESHLDACSIYGRYCIYLTPSIDEEYCLLINENKLFCKEISGILHDINLGKVNDIRALDSEIVIKIKKRYEASSKCWKNTIEEIRKYLHSLEVK